MSNCPRSASGTAMSASVTVMPTSISPLPSRIPTPTPSYTTTTRVESYIPTEPTLSTDPQTPGFVQNTSTGLIVGIVIPVFAVGLTVFLVIVIIFIRTAKKRRIQQTHASKWYIETKLIFYLDGVSFHTANKRQPFTLYKQTRQW